MGAGEARGSAAASRPPGFPLEPSCARGRRGVVHVQQRERGIEIELTDDARTLLGNLGYDPTYGARPLKRVIQRQLIDKLAMKLLEGEFADGDRIRVDYTADYLFWKAEDDSPERRVQPDCAAGAALPTVEKGWQIGNDQPTPIEKTA